MAKIGRREFLETAAVGTAGLLIAGGVARAAMVKPDPTGLVRLGKHLEVCRIGAGTGMSGGMRQSNQTRLGREKFETLIRYCYDQGVRLFDTADLYGSHTYLGRVLKEKPRDSYWLVSKLWVHPKSLPEAERPDADVCVKRYLRELQTDHLDLLQIHCVMSPKWPEQLRRQMDVMSKLKEQGLIRAHGVSVHGFEALKVAAEEPWVDVIHARVNPYNHATDTKIEKVVPVLQKAHANGKGIIGMKLTGEGKFDAQQRTKSVQFVMGLGCVDVLIVGFEKADHVDEFKGHVGQVLAS
jgi:aryl-alcohol dehydrogenase-like predicted oxidoreductase